MIFLCFPWDFPYDPISNPGFPAWPCTWPAQREAAKGPAGRRSASHSPSRGFSRSGDDCQRFFRSVDLGGPGDFPKQKGDD